MRFVASVGRQRRHPRGSEEMRIDGDADGHPRRFGNRLAYRSVAHRLPIPGHPEGISPSIASRQGGPVDLQIAFDCFCELLRRGPLVLPLFFRFGSSEDDPPRAIDIHEAAPDLEGSEVLEADGAVSEKRNHKSIAEHSCAGELRPL